MNNLGIIVIHSRRSVPNEYSAPGESMVDMHEPSICRSPATDPNIPHTSPPHQQQPPGPDILLRETALIIVPRMITSQNISSISRGRGGSSREPPVSCRCRRQVSPPLSDGGGGGGERSGRAIFGGACQGRQWRHLAWRARHGRDAGSHHRGRGSRVNRVKTSFSSPLASATIAGCVKSLAKTIASVR